MKVRIGLSLAAVLLIVTAGALAQDQSATPVTITVKSGDVPDLIAAQYDVDLVCLMKTNGLTVNSMIYPGDTLTISPDCPHYHGWSPVTATRDLHDKPGTYTVQPFDTLDGIARAFNVSAVALEVANDLPAGFILYTNDVLTIPTDAPPYGTYPALVFSKATGGKPYVIQPGDVPDLIAAFFDVDTKCLIERNQMTLPVHPGYQLRIPPDCPKYSGLSTPQPGEIHGLGVQIASSTPGAPAATEMAASPTAESTAQATAESTATAAPPSATPTATLAPPTATPTVTIAPPNATPEAVG